MTDDQTRALELEIEVPGTPEQVWRAIATGPGISSWYVPHVVEERTGGAATASFGPGPEMQIEGRVAAFEPPTRIVFDKGDAGPDDDPGLAFEWLVEARDGGSCVVRLVNTGFGDGAEWDDQYDGMREGWLLFLTNLRLHLTHFAGQSATSALPMGMVDAEPSAVWAQLVADLGSPTTIGVGDRLTLDPGVDAGRTAGTVVEIAPRRLALLLDSPAPGTAFVAVEGKAAPSAVSVWAYLYGLDRDRHAADFTDAWQRWLDARASTD